MDNSIVIRRMKFYISVIHTIDVLEIQCQVVTWQLANAVNLNAACLWDFLQSNEDTMIWFPFYQLMHRRKIFTIKLQQKQLLINATC